MLVFLITVLVVVILLILDRIFPKVMVPTKYTNLDWEVLSCNTYSEQYYGRIFSVIGNNVKTVYKSRCFYDRKDAEKFISKICRTMKSEYGIIGPEPSLYNNIIQNRIKEIATYEE